MHELVQAIGSADVHIYHFLTLFAGNPFLDRLVSHEETNNLLKGGIFFAVYWFLWFRATPEQDRRRKDIIAALIGAMLAVIAARTVAFIFPFRLRPINDLTLAHPVYSIPFTLNLENWSSFPSDTAAYFFALAFGIAYQARRLAVPVMVYTAAWICLPRMYLGVHYASDIVAGSIIGTLVAWLSFRSDLLQSVVAGRVLAAINRKPEWFYPIAFLLSFEMATIFAGLRDMGSGLLHAALISLDVPYSHSHASRPIDVWGGLLAMVFLMSAGYLAFRLYGKFRLKSEKVDLLQSASFSSRNR